MPRSGRGCPACRRDRVVDLAAAADRSLPRVAVAGAVDAVAPGGQALWHLEQALATVPQALSLGTPPLAGRLAAELIARGSVTLAARGCAACGLPALPGLAAGRRLQRVREDQACRYAHGRRAAAMRGLPTAHRSRQPPLRVLRQDRASRGPRPRRPAGYLRELLPDARGGLRRVRPAPRV